jgi:hypothetical protein
MIAWGLQEPVSHCGFRVPMEGGDLVVHSAFGGVEVIPFAEFMVNRELVFEMETPIPTRSMMTLLQRRSIYAATYDFLGFAYWVARTAGTRLFGLPKVTRNLWDRPHAFLCSELIAETLGVNKPGSIFSPYDAYLQLQQTGHQRVRPPQA